MSVTVNFTPCLPWPSNNLPLTLIFLDEWALVTLSGVDTVKYLQGQLTCDVTTLTTFKHCFAANCDAKGKMLSNMCVFHYHQGLAFIERRSVRDSQLMALKKYALFSHTDIIADDQAVLLGVAGLSAKKVLNSLFYPLPDIKKSVRFYHDHDTFVLYFSLPTERYLLITNEATCYLLVQQLKSQAIFNNSQQWLALDIEAGYPLIDSATSGKLFPQAVNLQALGGISFNKGCYVGQEMVARAQYRGANKRAMYWLEGKANFLPVVGEPLELKCGESWRCTGMVLASCHLNNGNIWVQAILNQHLVLKNKLQFRVQNDSASALIIRSTMSFLNSKH